MINNFLINRVLTITGFDKDENILYRLTQPQNVSVSTTSETADVVDNVGSLIARFDRSKSMEMTGENAIFDVHLLAEQHGTEVVTTVEAVPCFETITVDAANKENGYQLAHTPIDGGVVTAYTLSNDSAIADQLKVDTAAGAGQVAVADGKVSLPTDVEVGSMILVSYEYKPTKATMVEVDADKFATANKVTVELLGCDPCDVSNLIYAYLIIPSGKLSSDADLTFSNELVHNFTITANVAYCDPHKKLFYLVIPEEV